jgi:DNA polymerase-3 subunit beta
LKIRVERDEFARAVTTVAKSLPVRPAVPVLAGVKLTASDALLVEGFDYETSTSITVSSEVLAEGVVIVSGKLLADIAKSLPKRPVDMEVEGNTVRVMCGPARFTLPVLPANEYPKLPEFPETSGVVGTELFHEVIGQVSIAAGKDDTLPMLTGVKVEAENGSLTLAATDRFRLAVRKLDWDGPDVTALVPAKTLTEVARNVTDEAVHVGFVDGLFAAESAGVKSTARMLDAEFPKFRQLFPAEYLSVAAIDVQLLTDAVKRCALVAERGAQVRLEFGESGLTVAAGGDDLGRSEETIGCDFSGEPLTIAFNPQYLLDGLGAISTHDVLFGFTTPNRPAVLHPSDGDEIPGAPCSAVSTDFTYLLMPVRLPS